jgi:hypothetical protein
MKTLNFCPTNPTTYFTVTKNDINNNNALLPNTLYNEMQQFVTSIIANNPEIANKTPKLYKLEILKNAFLNDQLLMASKINIYNENELQLTVVVKQTLNLNNPICKAVFKFQLKNNFSKAC